MVDCRTGNWVLQRGDCDTTAGRHLFATDPRGTVVSLDPLTGKNQYSLAGAANVLAVDASQACAACGTNSVDVCAYDSAAVGLRWQIEPFLSPFPNPAAEAAEAGGALCLDKGDALDTATGKELTALAGVASRSLNRTGGRRRPGRRSHRPRIVDLYGLPGPWRPNVMPVGNPLTSIAEPGLLVAVSIGVIIPPSASAT